MPTVYSYLRFSRPEQMRGDSLRRQVEKSEKWAERKGYELDSSLDLKDLGVSAFRGKNAQTGALGLFLECIRSGRVKAGDYLALESLDRLSRQKISASLFLIQEIMRAGVSIVTLNPEREYPPSAVDDLGALIEMLVVLSRAYEESATKSERLQCAWKNKRDRAGSEKLTKIAPKWLKLAIDRKSFDLIPERVEIVKRIFQMAADGLGAIAIAKRLNTENVPVFGKGQGWHTSYIRKILRNRAVLGECQLYRMKEGKRVEVGEPIQGYYPAIIDEADFYAAAQAINGRKGKAGRHGEGLSNLFTGLLKDARDGSNLVITNKGSKSRGLSLISSAAKVGKGGAVYLSFPYKSFEQSLLVWGYDMQLGDVLPRKADNVDAELIKAEGIVTNVNCRIKAVKSKIASAGDVEVLLDMLVELDGKKKEAQEKVERLKLNRASPAGDALERTRSLIQKLRKASKKEAFDLRIKLRTVLKRLIRDVVVLIIQVNNDRVALADVQFQNGKRRKLTIMPGKMVNLPEGIEELDIREWKNWPKDFQKTRFDVISDEVQRMMDLEDEGYSRQEIARKLKTSKTHVSRNLIAQGRSKTKRKPADSGRLMTWHAPGCGWVKRHKGKRYFIGLGKLKSLYPALLKDRTEEGSWQAANRWWTEKLVELA